MSKVVSCPTCGGKAKIREKNGETTYAGLTDEEMGKKIRQLKQAMIKFKEKAQRLEKELATLQAGS